MTPAGIVLTIAFWSYCGGMSLLARSDRAWIQSGIFHASAATLYFALASGVAFTIVSTGHPLITVPLFMLVLILGTALGQPWLAFMVGEYFDRVRAVVTGTASMKVEKTYDKARKAEHDGDVELALRIYGEAAATDPADPEPLRRMAELHAGQGRLEEALGLLDRVSGLVTADGEGRAAVAFRRADLLERLGRRAEAAGVLDAVVRGFPGTALARGAQDRLDALHRLLR